MSEILPGLFLGGLASCTSEFLISNNVQALVTCCNEFDFGDPPLPITQFRIPVEDISNEPILDYMDAACQFISKHLQVGGVLIHCRSGVSRSATIVIGYLMKMMHYSLNDAFMLVISRRSCICPNIGFMRQLCILEESLSRDGEYETSQFTYSDGSVPGSRILDPPPPLNNPAVTTSSTCGCCLSEPSSPSPASERVARESATDQCLDPRRSATWSTTASAVPSAAAPTQVSQTDNRDIERLRSLGQALMASQYSSTFPAYVAVSDTSSESGTPQRRESSREQSESPAKTLSFDNSPVLTADRHPTAKSQAPPDLRVHSAGAISPHDRHLPQPVSLSSGPSPRTTFLTPRNAMSCVNSPDNILHSLAAKSPSLSMSKYISWYTMSGERARAPSLAP